MYKWPIANRDWQKNQLAQKIIKRDYEKITHIAGLNHIVILDSVDLIYTHKLSDSVVKKSLNENKLGSSMEILNNKTESLLKIKCTRFTSSDKNTFNLNSEFEKHLLIYNKTEVIAFANIYFHMCYKDEVDMNNTRYKELPAMYDKKTGKNRVIDIDNSYLKKLTLIDAYTYEECCKRAFCSKKEGKSKKHPKNHYTAIVKNGICIYKKDKPINSFNYLTQKIENYIQEAYKELNKRCEGCKELNFQKYINKIENDEQIKIQPGVYNY